MSSVFHLIIVFNVIFLKRDKDIRSAEEFGEVLCTSWFRNTIIKIIMRLRRREVQFFI